MSNCKVCGEPMPEGEEMFFYHGYSGPCPKPPINQTKNEYEPWKEIGLSELEYFKRRYLEMSQEAARLEMLVKIADQLITNENAQEDWKNAKAIRHM